MFGEDYYEGRERDAGGEAKRRLQVDHGLPLSTSNAGQDPEVFAGEREGEIVYALLERMQRNRSGNSRLGAAWMGGRRFFGDREVPVQSAGTLLPGRSEFWGYDQA